jgi:hypothetical protein
LAFLGVSTLEGLIPHIFQSVFSGGSNVPNVDQL